MGGYPKPKPKDAVDYKLSTGITLTFLIDNSKDNKKLEPALAFESK